MDLHIHLHTAQTQYMIDTYMLIPLCDLAYRIDLPHRSLYWSLGLLGAAPQNSSCSTHGYSHAEYGVSSSNPYVPGTADKEQERVRSLHIQGEADERGDDDGDGGDDDQDEGDDDGDKE
ncbi:hypothetical protein M9H77_01376 [Catharanthus roseus]|uniref:Uncharacterized protein n=1 Tax=Catharanthus roseus TaxID=4058 RepID=A0ACC0C5E4_CATRO|nr:hypothetical protein M9H77_01376 [Catharanthus roseus]